MDSFELLRNKDMAKRSHMSHPKWMVKKTQQSKKIPQKSNKSQNDQKYFNLTAKNKSRIMYEKEVLCLRLNEKRILRKEREMVIEICILMNMKIAEDTTQLLRFI